MSKRDKNLEDQALAWIEAILGESLPKKPYEDLLKDGQVLCRLINKLAPGSVKKIETKGMGFALMQNIERFQAAVLKYGVPPNESFQTVDLWEKKNIAQVTLCIHALGRIAQTKPDYTGPILGPKMSEENKREFTQEQLEAGKHIVSLQYGSNEGASQAGLNMGKRRMIQD
ncbi:myophilin-like [Liolophura sinensis]|uniref:myophilin-like n=1 Tax=Liolophura sinensis TaxID=3198878 RepID=UPI00315852EF